METKAVYWKYAVTNVRKREQLTLSVFNKFNMNEVKLNMYAATFQERQVQNA